MAALAKPHEIPRHSHGTQIRRGVNTRDVSRGVGSVNAATTHNAKANRAQARDEIKYVPHKAIYDITPM